MKKTARVFSAALALTLVLVLLPCFGMTAYATEITPETQLETIVYKGDCINYNHQTNKDRWIFLYKYGKYKEVGGEIYEQHIVGVGREDEWIADKQYVLKRIEPMITSGDYIFFLEELPVLVTDVTLSPTTASLAVGGTQELTATVVPTDATDNTVTWSSSNPAVATVSDVGVVTAVSAGNATITATATNGTPDDTGDDETATCTVTVNKKNQTVTAPAAKTGLVYTGSPQTLVTAASVTEGNTASGSITYSLDNSSWNASLPQGTDAGTYSVYYKVMGNDNYNEYVGSPPVSVTIAKADPVTPTGLTASVGQTLADVHLPEHWTWATPNQSVGSAGTKTFQANYAGDSNHKSKNNVEVSVTVSAQPTASVTTAPTAKTPLVYDGEAKELINSGTAQNGTMRYGIGTQTTEPASYSTTIPTGTNAGTYYVWYKAVGDSGYNDSDAAKIPVTIDKADPEQLSEYAATVGQTLADIELPDGWAWADATQSVGDEEGTKTFKANYTPTGADANNYKAKTDVDVTVNVVDEIHPTAVTLDKTAVSMIVGTETALTPTVTPANAPDKSVTWTSSDPAVTVDENGKVKAVTAGEAKITVTTADGGKTAECTVTSVDPANATFKNKTGDGQTYNNADLPFTFRFEEDTEDLYNYVADFKEVKLKGDNYAERVLSSGEYKAEKGSLNITLSNSLLKTLKPGKYTITVTLNSGGTATATFTIPKSSGGSSGVKTGDKIMALVVSVALFLLSLAVVAYILHKKHVLEKFVPALYSATGGLHPEKDDNSEKDDRQDEQDNRLLELLYPDRYQRRPERNYRRYEGDDRRYERRYPDSSVRRAARYERRPSERYGRQYGRDERRYGGYDNRFDGRDDRRRSGRDDRRKY